METLQQRGYWAVEAELLLADGAPQAALAVVEQLPSSAPHASTAGNGAIPRLGLLRGRVLAFLEQFDDAEAALQAGRAGAERQHALPLQWRVYLALGNLQRRQKWSQAADEAFTKAAGTIRSLAATVPEEPLRE